MMSGHSDSTGDRDARREGQPDEVELERERRPEGARAPVVTLAALSGAGGGVVGRRVAERLGVAFLDREVPAEVARRTGLSEEAVEEVDEKPRSRVHRLTEALSRAANLTGDAAGSDQRADLQEHQLRRYLKDALARLSATGGVALGRGGMVALAGVPGALHVYLGGSRDARIRRHMTLEGLDREAAEQRVAAEDAARIRYVRDEYGVDGQDPSLYHVMLDSTALDLQTCVDLIVAASRARTRRADGG
jgi:cytidylate kinase